MLIWFLEYPAVTIMLHTSYDTVHFVCSAVTDYSQFFAYIYPVILLMVCTIIATLNRNVPSGFNETQLVGKFECV